MAIWAGADVIDMECVQFHPTGMVWPLSVRGILVTEGVRGDGGVLRNSEGERFMFDYMADMFRAETAETEEEADRWYDDHINNRRTPELLPARRGGPLHQLRGEGGPGQPARRRLPRHRLAAHAEYIRRRLPSMYHQFMELAGVDITAEPMEVGPTCHYMMGGVRVDAETAGRHRPGPLRRRRGVGRHARRQPPRRQLALGPHRLRPPGRHRRRRTSPRAGPARRASTRRRSPTVIDEAVAPLRRARTARTPTTSTRTCRRPCRRWSGIIRTGPELDEALAQARGAQGAHGQGRGEGRPGLQPGLEPGHRPAVHDHDVHRRGPGRARPQGVTGRAHPRGLPGARPRDRARSTSCSARPVTTATWRRSPSRPSRCPRCRPSCAHCSRRPSSHDRHRHHVRQRQRPPRRPRTRRHHAGLAGGRRGRRVHRLRHARRRGRGGPRRHPPHPGRPTRRTWPAAGTARPASAARARPRSTACPGSCA